MHLLGAVAVYYRGSPQYSIVQKLFRGNLLPTRQAHRVSLGALPPRELAHGFGTIKASSWRCSGLITGVSQYSIVQKLFWGKSFPHSPGSQSCLWERFPPKSSLSGSVPSRHLFGAVAVYCRGSPQYSIVQKLFWGKSFPASPGSQSCLWERFPPRARSRVRYHQGIFLAQYQPTTGGFFSIRSYRNYSWRKSSPHPPAFQSSLWKRVPRL